MADANEGTRILDELLDTLELRLDRRRSDGHDDAITAVLNREPRRTAVTSLRDSPVVESFRQALTDGLIRVDTANKLLGLMNELVVRFL